MTFEQYKARLTEISNLLDSDKLPLEDSIKYFEESIRLSEECLALLNDKKGRITVLKERFSALEGIKGEGIDG